MGVSFIFVCSGIFEYVVLGGTTCIQDVVFLCTNGGVSANDFSDDRRSWCVRVLFFLAKESIEHFSFREGAGRTCSDR